MKKASKLVLSIVLILTMLMSTISVSATSRTPKSEENWEQIYDYQYSGYAVKIYKDEEVKGICTKKLSTKYKFVADGGKYNNVEYITSEAYNWSLSKDDYAKYTSSDETEYRNSKNYEILLKAIKKDNYLTISFNKQMPTLKKKLSTNRFSHLCLNCMDACRYKKVCRYCKGDLVNTEVKKTRCIDCKKSNYTSLAKIVCSTCKSTNIIKRDSLWQNCTDSSLKKVNKYINNSAVENSFANQINEYFAKNSEFLVENWEDSEEATICKAREKFATWADVVEAYYNISVSSESADEQYLITNAILQNLSAFSADKCEETRKEYLDMYKEFITEILLATGGTMMPSVLKSAPTELKQAIEKIKEVVDYCENIIGLYDEETPDDEKAKIIWGFEEEAIKSKYEIEYPEFVDKFNEANEYLSTAVENGEKIGNMMGELCEKVADDMYSFYEIHNITLNGKTAIKSSIKGLCEDIALATILKKVDEKLEIKEFE